MTSLTSQSTAGRTVPSSSSRVRNWYIGISWIPAALWLGSWAYIEMTDHWGAFAAAPLFAVSVGLSLLLGFAGCVLLARAAWNKSFDFLLAAATLLSLSVCIYAS